MALEDSAVVDSLVVVAIHESLSSLRLRDQRVGFAINASGLVMVR